MQKINLGKYFSANGLGKILFSFLLFSPSVLYGQVLSTYTMAEIRTPSQTPSSGTIVFQWIASNNSTEDARFFVLDAVPAGIEIQAVATGTSLGPGLQLSPSLPLPGPASLTIGPFPMAAHASVTFNVTETLDGASPNGKNKNLVGDTFALLSQTQLSGNKSVAFSTAALVSDGTPVSTAIEVSGGLIQSAVAGPNISDGNQPINFFVNLNLPAKIGLTLFTLTGEQVFETQAQGPKGPNTLVWGGRNNIGQKVASGLYLYYLRASGNGMEESKTGKVLVVH